MDFRISNYTSINLNFIIYFFNLYDSYNNLYNKKFPWLPLDSSALLEKNEKDVELKKLWSIILNSNNIVQKDYEYWENNEFPFANLLKDNFSSLKSYEYIKKTYEHWYWGSGNQLCNVFSDNLVEYYYKNLLTYAEKKHMKLKNQMFYLQTVYNSPPNNWEHGNYNTIIISPDKPLPSIEDTFKNYSSV